MKANAVLFTLVAAASGAAGIYLGIQHFDPKPAAKSASAAFFKQSLPDINGKSQNFAQWRGKALIVNFWATWCAPCVKEMPELSELQKEMSSKNVQVLGIGVDSAPNIAQFSAKYKITFPLLVADIAGTELARGFGNQTGGLPFSVLIAPDGRVIKTYLGEIKFDELRRDLASLSKK